MGAPSKRRDLPRSPFRPSCLQIFSASPRQWQFAHPEQKQIDTFVKAKKEYTINPVYFHASYLINLGFDNGVGKLSVKNLINELNLAEKMQIRGSIVHLGSLKRDIRSKLFWTRG